jgi:GntR family transcriptional regulator, transcriptional repressor for pyruvate dehydrogenase complex
MDQLITTQLLLEPIEQKTVTERVANRLLELISNGDIKPGDKLPPERELARRLNIGRTTVREALKLLTLSGLLEARRGDGTYVNKHFIGTLAKQINWPILLTAQELEMVIEVREALEIKAARLAAQRATDEDIERIAIYQELAEIQGRDIEREIEIDMAFHEAITNGSHNELLSSIIISLRGIFMNYIKMSIQTDETLEPTIAEHEAIYRAIAERNPDQAEEAMRQHLFMSKSVIKKLSNHDSRTSLTDQMD